MTKKISKQKRISDKIAVLRRELILGVNDVFSVSQRMAVCAKNHKILYRVVIVIFVYVMNSKYFNIFGVSAVAALLNQATSEHRASDPSHASVGIERAIAHRPFGFAVYGAKNPSHGRGLTERFLAGFADYFNRPLEPSGTPIALSRAVFSPISSQGRSGEGSPAVLAHTGGQAGLKPRLLTTLGTKSRATDLVRRDVVLPRAEKARDYFSVPLSSWESSDSSSVLRGARLGTEQVKSILSSVWMKVGTAYAALLYNVGDYPLGSVQHG